MLLKTKIEIDKWLNKYDIKNYELIEDEEYGYVVNVSGNVALYNVNLNLIEVKFNIVKGDFDCNSNELESLEGCPEIVKGDFDCSCNKLKILNGSPKIIEGFFNCGCNSLESLIGCPEIVNNGFYCHNNKLTMKGIYNNFPKEMKNNYIYLENNPELGELQNIKDVNELKKIVNIYKEKSELKSLLINDVNQIIKEKIIKI